MAQNPAPKTASTLSVSTAIALGGASLPTAGAKFAAATPAVVTSVLYSPDGAALYFNGSPLATGSSISGTTGKLAKFTAATTLGDSIITESGTTVTVANTLNATTLGGTLSTAAQPNITSVGTLTGGATGAGFTIALTTSTVTGTIPSANVSGSYTGITGVGTLTAGATGAGFTIALSTSTVTGTLSTTRGGTAQDTSGSTGVAQVAAGTWSVTTTLQNAVQDNITRLGTVTTGSFPAANLSGTTLAASVVTSSLTTVGALNAGNITSGFGSIDIGVDALTAGTGTLTTLIVGSTATDSYPANIVMSAGLGLRMRTTTNAAGATIGYSTGGGAVDWWSGKNLQAAMGGDAYEWGTSPSGSLKMSLTAAGALSTISTMTATAFIPSSSSVPTNGTYLSAANTLAFATNTTLALSINSSQVAAFVSSITVASAAVTVRNGAGGSTSTGASLAVVASDMGGGGAQSGHTVYVGRNSNATPAAGSIALEDLNGVPYFIWIDGAGKVRVNTSAPTNAGDTSGTIIGTQT